MEPETNNKKTIRYVVAVVVAVAHVAVAHVVVVIVVQWDPKKS